MPENGVLDLAIANMKVVPEKVLEGWPYAVGFSLINVGFAFLATLLPEMEDKRMEIGMKALVKGAQDTAKFVYWDGTIIKSA